MKLMAFMPQCRYSNISNELAFVKINCVKLRTFLSQGRYSNIRNFIARSEIKSLK
jgi:hypothetical protein